jgi:hypothetical protein
MRKFVLLAHILSAVSWIGVDLVMGVLSFRSLTTDDPQRWPRHTAPWPSLASRYC